MHGFDQLPHRPGVDLPAQFGLYLYLIALGHGDFPHIVAEAHDLQLFGNRCAHGGAHPIPQAFLYRRVLPVPGNDLARHPQPGGGEPVFAVAVGGLVQVHKIHVDPLVGDLAVVLGGKMAVGLLQGGKTVDPHFAGAEGVAPGNKAGTAFVVVGLAHKVGDLRVGFCRDLVDDLTGKISACVQCIGHFGGAGGHGFQNLGTVQELAAHHKPEFIVVQHIRHLLFPSGRFACSAVLYCAKKAAKPALSAGEGGTVSPSLRCLSRQAGIVRCCLMTKAPHASILHLGAAP